MTSTPEGAARRGLPWMPTAQTGWAARRAQQTGLGECYHCGSRLDACEGCDEARCLGCDPYKSDDCRWIL